MMKTKIVLPLAIFTILLMLMPSVNAIFLAGVGQFYGSGGLPAHSVNFTILTWDGSTFTGYGLIREPNQRFPTFQLITGVLTSNGYMQFTDSQGHQFIFIPTYRNYVVEGGHIILYAYGTLYVDGVPGSGTLNLHIS